jgi:hypothetical protein
MRRCLKKNGRGIRPELSTVARAVAAPPRACPIPCDCAGSNRPDLIRTIGDAYVLGGQVFDFKSLVLDDNAIITKLYTLAEASAKMDQQAVEYALLRPQPRSRLRGLDRHAL